MKSRALAIVTTLIGSGGVLAGGLAHSRFWIGMGGGLLFFGVLGLANEMRPTQRRRISIGDRVRVSQHCFEPALRGAVGAVGRKPTASTSSQNAQVVWIVFDPWVQPAYGDAIEASEVDAADLDPA